jgi:Flp pilus assembly pilin Flp
MKQYLKRFWLEEVGQSTTEYILILAVVVMVTMKFKTLFQGKLEGLIGTVGNEIDQAGASNAQ